MQGIGSRLRDARNQWKLTLQEVEDRSELLAKEWNNPAYRISASWLYRVEQETGMLSATKLIVLAVIYGLPAEQILGLCPPAVQQSAVLDPVSKPNATLLLSEGTFEQHARTWVPEKLVTEAPPEFTKLEPLESGIMPAHYRRGVIGKRDKTLDPMIVPGSVVLIDTATQAIAGRRSWTHEFDRPIYFLLTRTEYICGWCELDRDGEWLTVVPHPLSYEPSRRWRNRKEIEVVGKVAAIFQRRN